nr:DUF4157 domain-containing protein [Dechloromonas sp.]
MQAAARLVNRPPPVRPAAAVVQRVASGVQCQSLRVSSPGDAAEVEARRVARSVVSMPAPAAAISRSPVLPQRAETTATRPTLPGLPGGGAPLPEAVRSFMEPRFRADFSRVRIHTDERAAGAARQAQARAFTVGERIYFAGGQFRPETAEGRELLAHELTHTIQQGAAPQAVQRMPATAVAERSGSLAQRWDLPDPRRLIADRAAAIPGFTLLTVIIGRNPITGTAVERSAGNLLRGAIELMPGGVLVTQALANHGIFDRVSAWVEPRFAALRDIGSSVIEGVRRFISDLGVGDLLDPVGVWNRARSLVSGIVDRVVSFARNLVSGILDLIRDAVLRPLAGLAAGTRGWDLLCAVLGRNPITGEAVPRTAATLIGGFMRLIGQEEVWQNIQRGNAVGRAWAWFQGALAGLMGFVGALPGLFLATLRSLAISDLLTPIQTFARIARVFGDFAGRFIGWAGAQVMSLLEIIFEVVAPAVMPYLRRAAGALRTIVADPVRFIGNLVRAAVQGFRQFAANIVSHLRASIIGWLTGAMAGANLYIPQAFTLQEIIKFVLSVLGLTWQNIRAKLVRVAGERVVAAMETGFDIVVTLVRDGPAAAWERIRESLANLREMVMEQVLTFVRDNIVTAAVTRLVSMLNPAGAFIQAVIAIYNTVMFFVERLRQIAQVAAAFIDSIAAIAGGVITAAANRVEQTMAGLLTLVISFLARLVGLGRVSDAVTNIINRIRAPIDRALERVVDWIVRLGRRFMSAARSAAGRVVEWWRARKPFRTAGGASHEVYFTGDERNPQPMVASNDPRPIAYRLEQFEGMARRADASDDQRAALGTIAATRTALARNPDDRVVVSNLQTLFGLFDDPPRPVRADYQPRTGAISGDPTGTTVSTGMRIVGLNDRFRRVDHPGSEPQSSAQAALMALLPTNPSLGSEYKYIKGHVLNHRLGGIGNAENMFPLTANANSRHYYSVERQVVNWINASPHNWAIYEVDVVGIRADIQRGRPVGRNGVNATLQCRATLKDRNSRDQGSVMATITSEYRQRHDYAMAEI